MQKDKICVLKMGGQCNFNCKHCHSRKIDYKFNPDVLSYLRDNGFFRVTFSGGEPLMYFDTMKMVAESLGKNFEYKFVTNASLLNRKMISFFNEYNFSVFASYDGENSLRDVLPPPRYDLMRYLDRHGLAITVYEENNDIPKLKNDVERLVAANKMRRLSSFLPEFVHQTNIVAHTNTTLDTVKRYILQITPMLETEMIAYASEPDPKWGDYYALYKAIGKWWIKKNYKGIRCINERMLPLTVDGRFMACPYGTNFVGDIYTGVDWNKVDELTPKKCKICPIRDVCKGACWANMTSHECYLARTMHRWLDKVIDKWRIRDKIISRYKTAYETKNHLN